MHRNPTAAVVQPLLRLVAHPHLLNLGDRFALNAC